MKAAYATIYDASDITKWRRAGYFMAKSLETNDVDITYLGPLQVRRRWLTRPKGLVHNRLFGRDNPYRAYHGGRDKAVVRDLSRQLKRKLVDVDVDVVVSGESPFSQPVAYLDTDLPIVVWADVTLAAVIGFYPNYSHLCKETIRDGKANEAAALRRASLVIQSSEWAANFAVREYGLDPAKVKVSPTGPGHLLQVAPEEAEGMLKARPEDRCRLLFLAENWERKGGDVAVEIAVALEAAGLPTELLVAGCQPPPGQVLPGCVRILGWVDRTTPTGAVQFRDLLGSAHFLVLPTRADCTPMVVSEAAAHAVPSLTTDVGGLLTLVRDGQNGQAFALAAPPSDWATWVLATLADPEGYRRLARSTFSDSRHRLN